MSDGPTFARIDEESNDNNNNNNNGNNETGDANLDPWATDGGANNLTDTQVERWREHERRQRSVRSFMMFLMMMLLMDGEEQARVQQRRQREGRKSGGLRGTNNNNHNMDNINSVEADMELYRARRTHDRSIEDIVLFGNHSRVKHLVQRNGGTDFDREIRAWAEEQRNKKTRAFYEQILKDLVLEQPDGSYVKVYVASSSNNEAVHLANDPSKILLDAVSSTNDKAEKPGDDLKDAMKKFDDFLDSEKEVFHYPWNATGYYRGDWKIIDTDKTSSARDEAKDSSLKSTSTAQVLSPVNSEKLLLEHLKHQADPLMGVHILPPGMELARPGHRIGGSTDNTNANSNKGAFTLRGATKTASSSPLPEKLKLQNKSGKVVFHLYSKAVPAMKEISLIDGYVKVCDTNSVGYSTRRDILLRVHGVLIHSLGRLSLVANPRSTGRAAFILGDSIASPSTESVRQNEEAKPTKDSADGSEGARRRLQELLLLTTDGKGQAPDDAQTDEILTHALNLFVIRDAIGADLSAYQRIHTENDDDGVIDLRKEYRDMVLQEQEQLQNRRAVRADSAKMMEIMEEERRLEKGTNGLDEATENTVLEKDETDGQPVSNGQQNIADSNTSDKPPNEIYSEHVVPFPFAWDDYQQSLQRNRAPRSVVSMSLQEQSLEINAGSCEFEINLDVKEEKWNIRQWKKLMSKYKEHEHTGGNLGAIFTDSSTASTHETGTDREDKRLLKKSGTSSSKSHKRASMEQAWVMALNGTIVSPNCDFEASINTTAIRTDWDATTGKAVSYSFYMMTISLTQIVLLLRQLLHTQSQAASVRVSILCIGWQTVIDALLCLTHVYFCLAMQPLFTAFASVAFFKLLIFAVIEMKYMAIIIQARNASNGGNSAELLRRQIAMLHLRFYVALMGSCLGFLYSTTDYRTLYLLGLYSFWVPQIIHNVVTEAKKPMHPYYIWGTSITRMAAPLYMFANEKNFLKEVYPESPIDVFMCRLLVTWVGIQACVLYAQSRFGARFFIPSQFLPPKYDYNRPIPPSLLPSENRSESPSEQLQKDRELPKTEVRSLLPNRDAGSRGGVARNRKEGKRTKGETLMTAETVTEVPKCSGAPCIECVICYNDIDTVDRTAYMIAPCNHVFHKDCLIQWMEVKMECPICRQDLPAL
mmetsp:Transcript_21268/g.52692  ORF Transcript_21268/g.52692 Transcript_21268/m.52692 type:complete len:1156 (-) Transcript_21268:107-3574(-)